jgi:two-component system CheB/CheR fusion protein
MIDDAESVPLQPPAPPTLTVVGLGASAGGIRALKDFFSRVAPDGGVAYAVILHLAPDYESRLSEVLQVTTSLPVQAVVDRAVIEPNHVYVISSNAGLEVRDGMLVATAIVRPEQRRAPVDVFFRTLADAFDARAVVCVLSGTGPNGSAGLKRVKEAGGLVIVQEPSEAEYSDMPRNAIATGLVDLVVPIAEMPVHIARWHAHAPTAADAASSDTAAETADQEATREILTLVRVRTGHDFSNYKPATVRRRIARRMHVNGVHSTAAYGQAMRDDPNEPTRLIRELLISVTRFFRDPDAFAALAANVLPRVFKPNALPDHVRVWVPGCATGEEAYSVAMLLAEYAAHLPAPPALQIFATDLDDRAIAVARDGLYSDADVADLSEERLAHFFTREAGGYRISRELRECVLFAPHNVIKDPPFSHLDLISCRNLLIYLTRPIQERLLETFHFALRPGAFLFLGSSESPDGSGHLFAKVDQSPHVYESRPLSSRPRLPQIDTPLTLSRKPARPADPRVANRVIPIDLHQRLLEQLAPPSLIVTDEHDLVHISEGARQYLQVAAGEPTHDLLRLVRPELRHELRTALHTAMRHGAPVDVQGVRVVIDDTECEVNLSIRPVLREGDPARGFFVILFDAQDTSSASDAAIRLTSPAEPLMQQLEDELSGMRAELRSVVEQYETQAEESKAGHEELQAMNEELRSAAEELETSKEELQSVNEELTTVNQELKIKIEELRLTNNDFQNFINATDIGTIFLDRGLRVKVSTVKAKQIFNLLDADTGRPLSDITSRLRYDHIHQDVKRVLEHLQTFEREVMTDDGVWHLMRILPYRTTDHRIDGVVLTFQDITSRVHAEQQVRHSEERLRLLIDSAIDYAIFTMNDQGVIDSWNSGAQRMFGYRAEEIVGLGFEILFVPEDRASGQAAEEIARAMATGRAGDERYHLRQNGTRFYCSGVTIRLGGGRLGLAKIARDLTDTQDAKTALEAARADLENRVTRRTAALAKEIEGHNEAAAKVQVLIQRLVGAQEEERQRLSRDLHDEVGQQLTALRLALERAPGADEHVASALQLTNRISREIDFIAWQLRPAVLDELGLAAALPRFVETWASHVGVSVESRVDGYETGMLPGPAEVAFYRILQEALHNVAKHAAATRVDVVLAVNDGRVVLVVEDDGIGFDTTAPTTGSTLMPATAEDGFGLSSMRERAGLIGATLLVESAPGKGTSVLLRYPLPTPAPRMEAGAGS